MNNNKTFIFYGAVFSVVILIFGFSFFYASQFNDKVNKATGSAAVYTCPMHPEVISDVPGDCPKCGMALVLKDETKQSDNAGCCGDKMSMDKCGKMSGHEQNSGHDHDVNKNEKTEQNQDTGNESKHKGCMGH